MLKKFIQKSAKHPVLSFIVAVQIIFILALLFKACVTPKTQVSLGASALFNTDDETAYIEDDVLKFVGSVAESVNAPSLVPYS